MYLRGLFKEHRDAMIGDGFTIEMHNFVYAIPSGLLLFKQAWMQR